jgi:hypothetical protein
LGCKIRGKFPWRIVGLAKICQLLRHRIQRPGNRYSVPASFLFNLSWRNDRFRSFFFSSVIDDPSSQLSSSADIKCPTAVRSDSYTLLVGLMRYFSWKTAIAFLHNIWKYIYRPIIEKWWWIYIEEGTIQVISMLSNTDHTWLYSLSGSSSTRYRYFDISLQMSKKNWVTWVIIHTTCYCIWYDIYHAIYST